MIEVEYTPAFVREWKKLSTELQDETLDKIELFRNRENHSALRVHKLKGSKTGLLSFSINFRYRLVFIYKKGDKNTAQLLDIGDHTVYD